MNPSRKPTGPLLQRIALIVSALILCLLLVFTIRTSPPPVIDLKYGDTTIEISADRAWTLFPGDCVKIQWELEGIQSLYIDDEGKIGWGEMSYCPSINATSPLIEVTAINGIYRRLSINIHHLPDLLFYLAGFVGLIGSSLLAIYFLWVRQLERPLPVYWLLIGGMLLVIAGSWLRLTSYEPPLVDVDDGDVAVRLWAEHDRTLFPHECVTVWWSLTGATASSFNGNVLYPEGNRGQAEHCAEDGDRATLEIIADDGTSSVHTIAIPSLFPNPRSQPLFTYWSLFGILLGLMVYIPLAFQALRERWHRRTRPDFIGVAGCLFVVLILYLPFGFDSSGQWEEWIIHGYAEGGTLSFYRTEAVSRPWVMIPHTAAYLISSESFIGYHLVNFLLYAGRMILLYGILRKIGISPLYAFLTTILFMVYPVNDALMTLRRLPKNFSVLTLLLSTYLFLDFCRNRRRLTLLGVWLGLLYSVNSNETGYAVILIVPLLLWLRDRQFNWRKLNLTAMWYVVPAFKLASVILLLSIGRDFYQSGLLNVGVISTEPAADIFATFFEVIGIVYPQTFLRGWREALTTLDQNLWWLPTVIILAGAGGIAWYHVREAGEERFPNLRGIGVSLLSGLLFIIPAVGVLMWIPLYRTDPWRMYLYVPVGAAIAVFSLILLLCSPIRDFKRRNFIVVLLCILLMIPSLSKLFLQLNGYVDSAQSKAQVLHQVLAIAPEMEPETQLAMVTEINNSDLGAIGIRELLRSDMFNSAIHVLYQGEAPEFAYFCASINECGDFAGDETIFSASEPEALLQRTLVFKLNKDLSVELIEDPATYLGLDFDPPYDASLLYNADAPLPSRASTMLGAALRD